MIGSAVLIDWLTQPITRDRLDQLPLRRDGPLAGDAVPAAGAQQVPGLAAPAGSAPDGRLADIGIAAELPRRRVPAAGGPVHPQRQHGQHVALRHRRPVRVVAYRDEPHLDHGSPPPAAASATVVPESLPALDRCPPAARRGVCFAAIGQDARRRLLRSMYSARSSLRIRVLVRPAPGMAMSTAGSHRRRSAGRRASPSSRGT